mgnify:CR=1 FL=1
MKNHLDRIAIVLVEPTHPGNIGAVARAMKTMGLNDLRLVNPLKFPHIDASKRAAGADDVLDAARCFDSLKSAVSDCVRVIGTSVRDREVTWPTFSPRTTAEQLKKNFDNEQPIDGENSSVAVVFGRESSGLRNAELDLCDAQIRIPANEEYSSLNLGSAVQIICYELRLALWVDGPQQPRSLTPAEQRQQPASKEMRAQHIEHLARVLEQLDFVKSKPPTMLIRKLTRLYNKADLSIEEIHILRGILTAVEQASAIKLP